MPATAIRTFLMRASTLLLTLAAIAPVIGQPAGRTVLQPASQRKAAPQFALKDSTGRTISLTDYRGKVVLLDFWATWCTGCKMEIPWFSEFQKAYGAQGFAVVGVSMDERGWTVVKPFLAETHIPYPILLGDDRTAERFGIQALPDTFLIDRSGKVAAAYKASVVDKNDIEANIKALLSER
jgi:cytochrome c biogenesis protein CcmG/thiol:disulfide interchange protein DsbE